MALSPRFVPVAFSDLPGWRDDACMNAFFAFRRSALHAQSKPYKTGALGVEAAAFAPAFAASLSADIADDAAARAFFEAHFSPFHIAADDGGPGFVTGFYEPEVNASPIRTAEFQVPILSRPADLVDVNDENRPAGLDPYFAFARHAGGQLVEYHDREAIAGGVLAGRGLELFWLQDRVDLFFIQVQGAARCVMPDGAVRRISYAAKTGQRFTGIGRLLVDMGEIPLAEISMQSIRAWLKANPSRIDEVLWKNRSYVFFRETEVGEPKLGPIAAAKVQLTSGRSIAVDRLLHTFATPFFVDAPQLTRFEGLPFRRLMIAQDTGSAIVGPARGDLFAGSGFPAGEIAGGIRSEAAFYALIPRALAEAQS